MKVSSFQPTVWSPPFSHDHRLVLQVHSMCPFICILCVLSYVFHVHLNCMDHILFAE